MIYKFRKMGKKSIPLYLRILLGMVLGIAAGVILVNFADAGVITKWIKPFGDIFMRLLKFIAIPLILLSLIGGVANLGDIKSLSKIGTRTLLLFLVTTIIAILIGLLLVEVIKPGDMVSDESAAALQSTYHATVAERSTAVVVERSPLQPLVDIFPENLFGAIATNGNMLQVICIAILMGIAMLLVGKERSEPFARLVSSLNDIVLKIVDIIMMYAPFGVFALMCAMIGDSAGDVSLLGALGLYSVTIIAGMLLMIVVVYPIFVKLFTKIPLGKFFKAMLPIDMVAFSTSSSAATLPVTLQHAEQGLGISPKTASFVLPVGVTINMGGTSCYQVVAVVFIAQVFGIELGWMELLTLIAMTTISSIGTPGIPGGSFVILMMVMTSVGIPPEGLALILGVDRPLDMLRTIANVTGDVTVAAIVDEKS